jgi:hypothetical protein
VTGCYTVPPFIIFSYILSKSEQYVNCIFFRISGTKCENEYRAHNIGSVFRRVAERTRSDDAMVFQARYIGIFGS